jgi:hypothetical protein
LPPLRVEPVLRSAGNQFRPFLRPWDLIGNVSTVMSFARCPITKYRFDVLLSIAQVFFVQKMEHFSPKNRGHTIKKQAVAVNNSDRAGHNRHRRWPPDRF